MPKYLIQASYTAKGITGLLKEGGSSRKSTVEQTISGLGGKVEAYHYAFGEWDVFVIAEMPDEATAAAVVLAFGASGAVSAKTTVLIDPETIDQAAGKAVSFRPPGG